MGLANVGLGATLLGMPQPGTRACCLPRLKDALWGQIKLSLERLGEAGQQCIPAHTWEDMSDLQDC